MTPGKIHIKPSGGDGRLHNRGSAVLLPLKCYSAPLFGFMSKDYVEHAGCRVMNQPTEQNIVALSLTTQAFHGDQIARRICCRPASDSALHGRALAARLTFWEIQLCFEMNSQCLWIKKKKKKKGFRLSAILLKWECVTFP